MQKEYEKRIYIIPANFALDGKWMGFEKMNILEAAAVLVIFLVPVLLFLPTFTAKIYGVIFCALPTLAAAVGVNGLSVTSFLADMIHYRACNTVYATPTKELILIRERQIIKEKHRILEERAKETRRSEREQEKLRKKEEKAGKKRTKKSQKKGDQVFG